MPQFWVLSPQSRPADRVVKIRAEGMQAAAEAAIRSIAVFQPVWPGNVPLRRPDGSFDDDAAVLAVALDHAGFPYILARAPSTGSPQDHGAALASISPVHREWARVELRRLRDEHLTRASSV
jgi:hypothetical protein